MYNCLPWERIQPAQRKPQDLKDLLYYLSVLSSYWCAFSCCFFLLFVCLGFCFSSFTDSVATFAIKLGWKKFLNNFFTICRFDFYTLFFKKRQKQKWPDGNPTILVWWYDRISISLNVQLNTRLSCYALRSPLVVDWACKDSSINQSISHICQ